MNLAYKYPIIFWNTACLISDAGGEEEEEEIDEEAIEEDKAEEPYSEEMPWFDEDEDEEESSYDEDDGENGWPATIVVTKEGKKKKKAKATNYGKIATAIGKITSAGIKIEPPDINKSSYTFAPDIENNAILYGLSGITRIGEDLVKSIMKNRPYSGIEDFLQKVKVNKPQMINLIKCGAFDGFDDRFEIMQEYVNSISGAKKRITLQNMASLIEYGLIPDEYDLQRRCFNFNKYIKKKELDKSYYEIDEVSLNFFNNYLSLDDLTPTTETETGFKLSKITWDNIYKAQQKIIRPFVQKNADKLLDAVNARLTSEVWDKYCKGSISKWEMDSISCYISEHELADANPNGAVKFDLYGNLDEEPQIDYIANIKGKSVPIYYINRIIGTVLDRDKSKKTVTILTTDGVVTVKIYGGVFQVYDKQISERGADGKKHVLEKSAFSRGNKIIITGVRSGETEFLCKKYKKTPFHRVELIEDVVDGNLITRARNEEED